MALPPKNTASKAKAKKPASPKSKAKPAAEKKPRTRPATSKKVGAAGAEDRKRLPPLVDLRNEVFVYEYARGQPWIQTLSRCTFVDAASHDVAVTLSTATQEFILRETVGSMRTAVAGAIVAQMHYLLHTQQCVIHDPGKGPHRNTATSPNPDWFKYLKWAECEELIALYPDGDFPLVFSTTTLLNRGSPGTHTSVITLPAWVLDVLKEISGCLQRETLSYLAESFFARMIKTRQCLRVGVTA